jgi:hypothetical protein
LGSRASVSIRSGTRSPPDNSATGVPHAVVSERLSHADQNITLSIYSHALPADTRAAAKIWNDAMADVIWQARKSAARDGMLAHVCREGTEKEGFIANKRS